MSTVLQQVVFPTNMDPDVLPLYVDPDSWAQVHGQPVRLTDIASIDNILSRRSVRVRKGRRVSYASYFNAFPASYWQRWSVIENVQLHVTLSGKGTIIVYRSNSNGQQQRIESRVTDGEKKTHIFDLPLNKFVDGGWYWFDIIAGDNDVVLEEGSWRTDADPTTKGKLSLGMCTFNKSEYCIETLKNIAAAPELLAVIDQILLVDQGTKKVQDEAEFAQVQKQLGQSLRVINQGNLGGSGGYSRAMAETLNLDETDFLLLLDDDIEFEPESALRALQFGRFSREPVIVGGHMFDLFDKPVLHAWAEVVRSEPFMWGPSFDEQHRHNFKERNLRQTPWLHARLDADYNGWWMCMIPKKVIAEIGLSLPIFIKWDDAEYCLRAREHGYRTVSLPGMALWHMSWLDKDDSQDWQAYFHTRNRIIAALLHSPHAHGGGLLQNNGKQDVKKLLNMQYYATQLAVDALRDVLAGPDRIKDTIATAMPQARALANDYPEAKVWRSDAAELAPTALGGRALPQKAITLTNNGEAKTRQMYRGLTGTKLALFTAKTLAKQWLRKDAKNNIPELEYAKSDASWWVIPQHESVIVGAADGAGKMVYAHNSAHFKRLLRESSKLHLELYRRWPELSKEYRSAFGQLVSPESWWQIFDKHSGRENGDSKNTKQAN